jgi:hypothetical protein
VVSVLVSSSEIVSSSPGQVKSMTMKLVSAASPLSTGSIKEEEERLGIWLLCPNVVLVG